MRKWWDNEEFFDDDEYSKFDYNIEVEKVYFKNFQFNKIDNIIVRN